MIRAGLVLQVDGDETPPNGDPARLADGLVRGAGDDVHLRVHEAAFDKLVRAAKRSGALQRAADEAAADSQPGLRARVHGVRGEIRPDALTVRIELQIANFCAAPIDLVYALDLVPSIADGRVVIERRAELMGIDGWDVFACVVSGIATWGLGLALVLGRLIWGGLEALGGGGGDPAPWTVDRVFTSALPLPGTELRPRVTARRVALHDGALTSGGTLALLPDRTNTYVYARFEDALLGRASPIAGATVTLRDQDRPAPAGDDVVIPETGTVEYDTHHTTTSITTTYATLPDATVAQGRTDGRGRVRFVLTPAQLRSRGGVLTTTTTTEILTNPDAESDSVTTQRDVPEPRPDLYFSVRRTSGTTSRTATTVNVAAGTHVGTGAEPQVFRFGARLP